MSVKIGSYTPGPWHVQWDNPVIVQNEPGQAVADCDSNVYIEFRAKESNARLIAAAPDLLEALKELLEGNPPGKVEFHTTEFGIDLARKAIAKAEGRDS